jgi:hypothetical protein
MNDGSEHTAVESQTLLRGQRPGRSSLFSAALQSACEKRLVAVLHLHDGNMKVRNLTTDCCKAKPTHNVGSLVSRNA